MPTYGSMGSNYEDILRNMNSGSTSYARTGSYGTGSSYTTGGAGGKTYVRVSSTSGGSGYGSYGSFSGSGTVIGGGEEIPKEKRYARF